MPATFRGRKLCAALILLVMLGSLPAPASNCAACQSGEHPQATTPSAHGGAHCMKSSAAMNMNCRQAAASSDCAAGAGERAPLHALPAAQARASVSVCLGRAAGSAEGRPGDRQFASAAIRAAARPNPRGSGLILRI